MSSSKMNEVCSLTTVNKLIMDGLFRLPQQPPLQLQQQSYNQNNNSNVTTIISLGGGGGDDDDEQVDTCGFIIGVMLLRNLL